MKELFGENWREIQQKRITQEVESEIGGEYTPRVFDFADLYDYFDPVFFYKELESDKTLKVDFNKFVESEQMYEQAIRLTELELERIANEGKEEIQVGDEKPKEENDNDNSDVPADADRAADESNVNRTDDAVNRTDDAVNRADGAGSNYILTDGVDEEDKIDPVPLDENGQPADEAAVEEQNKKQKNEKKAASLTSKKSLAKARLNWNVSRYLGRFVPVYNKYVCSCCGLPKTIDNFYTVYDMGCNSRIDKNGSYHMHICKECCQKMFAYNYSVLSGKDVEKAVQFMCAQLNLYWNPDMLYIARKEFDDSGRRGTLIGTYISVVNREVPGNTFMDSPFLTAEQNGEGRIYTMQALPEDTYDWSKEDYDNKRLVIKMCGYDPFKGEEENDRKILYKDLLSILTDGMENDYIKLQAGINIVYSFFKIRKMTEQQTKLEREGAPLAEQKALSDLKAKELAAVSTYAKDNGMSERYQNAKSKGELTLTGMMRAMNEKKYEDDIVNRYDIETSSTIQQAAEASFKAIMGQLSLSDAEVWKLTQDQYAELVSLRREKAKLEEDLRKEKYKVAEMILQEKARLAQKESTGISDEEFDE